mmetsp:Transcript_31178/g.35778  ORF Transcript_31178/g.35778 Transcript_31178/m.35778 type:complete len:340 (-) Transcript_31178:178-1197(-)
MMMTMDSSRISIVAATTLVVGTAIILLVSSFTVVDAFSFQASTNNCASTSRTRTCQALLRMAEEEEVAAEETAVDVSIPYDAAARLAFCKAAPEEIGADTTFEEFQVTFLAEAVELVKSKQEGYSGPSSASASAAAPVATTGGTQFAFPGVVEDKSKSNPLLDQLPGNTRPIKAFDPLQLASCGSDETLNWFRAAELKHSRVAMLAVTGYLVQAAGYHWPGMISDDLSFAQLSGLKPFDAWDQTPDNIKSWILFFAFCTELATESDAGRRGGQHYMKGGKSPEVVFPKFDFSNVDADTMVVKRSRELNNGRLAMIGIISFIAANNIPGSVPALSGLDMF